MKVSAAVVTYQMEREWPRTLATLEPQVDEVVVKESTDPSPCRAMNEAVAECQHEIVLVLIDGARMLSPGVVKWGLHAFQMFPSAFVYTLSMHLGPVKQGQATGRKEDIQAMEDRLLARASGYDLFRCSVIGGGATEGFWGGLTESNAFLMRREDYFAIGGYDERFTSPGGGLCNLDFFLQAQWQYQPVALLGEASFHQFHGGVASNSPPNTHREEFEAEWERIYGSPIRPKWRRPVYLGEVPLQAEGVFGGPR